MERIFKKSKMIFITPYRTVLAGLKASFITTGGTAVAQWLRCCATNRTVAGAIPVDFSLKKSFRSHYGPGVDSASDRNEYQEHFLGVKA